MSNEIIVNGSANRKVIDKVQKIISRFLKSLVAVVWIYFGFFNIFYPNQINLDLDDFELKNLLDEAYSYKGPKDKENKSEIFKELLHKAELEDQQQDSYYSSRPHRGNSRRHHTGGSLQDLVESVNNEIDGDYMLGPQLRRHQQHSRYTKNSSSVSSRQREGGSLPNNVNSSSGYSISSFSLSKYPKNNTKISGKNHNDYERSLTNHHRNAFIGESEESQQSIPSTSAGSCASDKNHTIINIDDPEEARHSLAHDSLAQDTSEANRDDGTELVSLKKQRQTTMSFLSTNVKDIGESSRQSCHVDQQIQFMQYPTESRATQLNSRHFVKSSVEQKYTSNRNVHLNQIQVNPNKLDENGNAILPKPTTNPLAPSQGKGKSKRSKADRNTTTWIAPSIECDEFSADNIESILAFIENKETTKKTNVINVNKNNLSVTDKNRKEKKNSGNNNKKEVGGLKKSTSMEELKSSSKIEEEIAQSERAQVSLRQKQLQQQNAQKRNSTSETKEFGTKQSSQRRSWGTEELNDFDVADDRDPKKPKENKPNLKNNKKMEHVASTNASIESIPMIEAAEFHVVTKKKKTKKRQIIEEAKAKQQQMNSQRDQTQSHGRNFNSNATIANKYQPSSTYTNDRDIYVNSLTTKENRRKSTSSVPPSDKSDSSDLDSVHSLPIESTTTSTSIISYAEIARKANNNQPEKLSNANAWPAVSHNGKSSESPENSNTSTSSSTVSSKSHTSNRSNDTIKASSPIEDKFATNFDDSKTMDTPKSQPVLAEYVKNQLQKSKSVDSDKYSTTMSLDQFPGLEKTVKPQKSHPNFASVLTSSPPSAERVNKCQLTKKPMVSVEPDTPAKENIVKVQKIVDESIDCKAAVDTSASKLVFVQNSAKVEEIVNSETSSNLFVTINSSTVKKTKKSQPNANSTTANASSKNNNSQRTVRQTAVVFSDRETNHENVSPLLFGDFNDDILQLMKLEEDHIDDEIPDQQSSIHNLPVNNCTNAFECADYHAINDSKQSKPNNHM